MIASESWGIKATENLHRLRNLRCGRQENGGGKILTLRTQRDAERRRAESKKQTGKLMAGRWREPGRRAATKVAQVSQPAVSPISNRQGVENTGHAGTFARFAGWKH